MHLSARRLFDPRVILVLIFSLLALVAPSLALAQDPVPLLRQQDVVVTAGGEASGVNTAALRDSAAALKTNDGVNVKYLVTGQLAPDLAGYLSSIRTDLGFDGVLVVITPDRIGASAALDDEQIVATLRAEGDEAGDATEMAIKSAERLVSQQRGNSGQSLLRIAIIGLICVLPLWLIWYFRATPRFGDDPGAVNIDASSKRRPPSP